MPAADPAILDRWRQMAIVDRDGATVGTISEFYLDKETGHPTWALVSTGLFGTRHTFVPLLEAREVHDGIQVPYPKAHVKGAPSIELDGELTPDEEARLFTHYGLDYATSIPGPESQPSGQAGVGEPAAGPPAGDAGAGEPLPPAWAGQAGFGDQPPGASGAEPDFGDQAPPAAAAPAGGGAGPGGATDLREWERRGGGSGSEPSSPTAQRRPRLERWATGDPGDLTPEEKAAAEAARRERLGIDEDDLRDH